MKLHRITYQADRGDGLRVFHEWFATALDRNYRLEQFALSGELLLASETVDVPRNLRPCMADWLNTVENRPDPTFSTRREP